MTNAGLPRLATLDDDGWTLENAEHRFARSDDLYWLPSHAERLHLREGFSAKLIFLIRYRDETGAVRIQGERMWVELTVVDGDFYHGHLDNEPHTKGTAELGMEVWFRAEHVIDFIDLERKQASERAEVLQCASHGLSMTCYVCEHILSGKGVGFNFDTSGEQPRPDAWCDECDRLLDTFGGWDDVPQERHPKIEILCGGCYDAAKLRNLR